MEGNMVRHDETYSVYVVYKPTLAGALITATLYPYWKVLPSTVMAMVAARAGVSFRFCS